MKKVVIAGASGLVGGELLKLLLQDKRVSEVVALVRYPLSVTHLKLNQILINFDDLSTYRQDMLADVIYCCLGSTKKKTPKLRDYSKVDHDYPLRLAEIASENNVGQYHLVSALGANKHSKIFYKQLKGRTEQDLKRLSFGSVHIYQPSLLVGNRLEQRRLEKLFVYAMNIINPLLLGTLKKYRSIHATTVAQAMINQTFKDLDGVCTYPSHIIQELA